MSNRRWFPLESNPITLNNYIEKIGFDTDIYKWIDVFSIEDWALETIPQPVVAVIMLYPITDVQEKHRSKECEEFFKSQHTRHPKNLWYMKQRIDNACGTIGILHALANIPESLKVAAIDPSSWLGRYLKSCPVPLSPLAKAEILESNGEIEKIHEAATSDTANHTNRGSLEDSVNTHFVALVNVNGGLYELDGRKEGPIRHGDITSQRDFLKDACRIVDKFMKRDPKELRFTILALAPARDEES